MSCLITRHALLAWASIVGAVCIATADATVDVQPINVTRGSSSVSAGGSLSVTWQIRNNGNTTAATSNSQVRITTSSSSYGTSSNNAGSSVSTGTISAGASKSQSKTVTVPTTAGTYYVWVIADNNSALTQTNYTNDYAVSSSFTVTASTTVDVQPLNVTRGSSSVTAGGSLSVSWQIRNNGTGTAASSNSQVRITTSSSSYGTSSNNAGSSVSTGTIAAGATINQSKTVTVPTTSGTYYVWVIADNNSALTQTNVTNDYAVSSSFTVTAATTVDVQPLNVTRGSSSVTAGGSLAVSWQIRNNGTGTAATSNSQVRITTSSSSYGTSSNNVGSSESTGTIAAGATINQSKTVTVPTTSGTYYVWVLADNNSALTQTNVTNDYAVSSSFTVTAATTVDVQPLNVTRGSSSVTAGGSLAVSWQIRNNGTGSAASSNSQVRITNSSSSYGTSSNNVGSAQATGTIGAGVTISQNTTVTVPTTAGTYYVWVIADNNSALTQTDVTNDYAVSSSFTVTAATTVDVQPLNVTRGSSSVTAGGSLVVSWQIRNNGTGVAATSNSQVRITTSNATNGYGSSSNNVGSPQATGTIAAGVTVGQSATVTVPTTPGTYYAWVVADNNVPPLLSQTDVTNDYAVSISFTVTSATTVDVQPLNVTRGNSIVTAGSTLAVSWQIRNNGTGTAASSNSQVRITTSNATNGYGSSSNNVGSPQATGTIGAGVTINQNTTVTVPTTPGTYYVWVIADNNVPPLLTQTNVSNDFAVSASFTVTSSTTVDVQPLNVTRGSSSVTAGGSLAVSWQIRNNGTGAATSSNSQVRITTSNATNGYGSASNNVGSPLATGTIGAGATINQNATVTVPTTPGTYYVWVVADNNVPPLLTQTNVTNDFAVSTSFTVQGQTSTTPGSFTLSNQSPYWDPNPPAGPATRLNWTFSNGATSYDVYRNSSLYAGNITALSFLNNLNLIGGQTYSYYVVAKNSYDTRQSNIIQITMPTAPTTTPATLASVRVSGPSTISPGNTASYQCFAVYSDGLETDVTTSAQWAITGTIPPSTFVAGGVLQIGTSATGGTVTITASYQTSLDQQKRTGQKSVTISSGFAVSASSTPPQSLGGNNYRINFSASPSGGAAPYSFTWDTNEDEVYGDLTGQNPQWSLSSSGGTYRVKVRATDGQGRTAYATQVASIDKPVVVNQPEKLAPASSPAGGVFLDKNGNNFQFDSNKVANGLIVLTHGWKASGSDQWLKDMFSSIEQKIPEAERPNILIYNWEDDSDPAKIDSNLLLLAKIELQNSGIGVTTPALKGLLTKALTTASVTAFLEGVVAIRWSGKYNGIALGNMLLQETSAIPPRVDFSKPVHFIGHSAGGFVVGEAANVLRQKSAIVDRVTMLDTPFPWKAHLSDLPNETVVEQYISSIYGALEFYNTRIIPEDDYHWRLSVIESVWDYAKVFLPSGHERSHEWYQMTVPPEPNYDFLGFYNSPFVSGPVVTTKQASNSNFGPQRDDEKPLIPLEGPLPESEDPVTISGFSTFGNVSENSGTYTITELADAGIFKSLTIPHGIASFRFKFRFSGESNGDFIGVRFGQRPEIYAAPDGPVTRGEFLQAEIELGAYAGVTDEIVFTLVSRNSSGAVLEIKDIEIVESDDPDGDGLTVAEEIAAGTSSQNPDSDGDGWSDSYEVNVSLTDPTKADTDGDGVRDPDELFAGTDPNDSSSIFAVKETIRNSDGSITLRWSAELGKSYRILMSSSPAFDNFETIASKLTGITPITSYTIPSNLLSGIPSAFFRVGVE